MAYDTSAYYPSLKDRVVLITGGSRGLGWVMAEALLRHGAKVAITATDKPDRLNEAVEKGKQIAGEGRIIGLLGDVRDYDVCQRLVQETLDAFGALHVLINNAGVGLALVREDFASEELTFWNTDPAPWRQIIEVNLIGAFQMAKAAAPHFIAQNYGKILNISTSLTTMVIPGFSPYGASKAGLETATMCWAKEFQREGATGVTCNVYLPGGGTDTEFIPLPGVSQEDRAKMLLPAENMGPPVLWLCAAQSDDTTMRRFIAKFWDQDLPPHEAVLACIQPAREHPEFM